MCADVTRARAACVGWTRVAPGLHGRMCNARANTDYALNIIMLWLNATPGLAAADQKTMTAESYPPGHHGPEPG